MNLALIGGGVLLFIVLVWFLIRSSKKRGEQGQVIRDFKQDAKVKRKQEAVKRPTDKSASDSLRDGEF